MRWQMILFNFNLVHDVVHEWYMLGIQNDQRNQR